MDDLVKEIRAAIDRFKTRGDVFTCEKTGRATFKVTTAEAGMLDHELYIPNPYFTQPPLALESRFGFSNIAGRYALPAGLDAENLQTYANVLRHQNIAGEISEAVYDGKLGEVLAALIARNSDLANIDIKEGVPQQKFDVILGVASAFNVKDIQSYLDGLDRGTAMRDARYKTAFESVQEVTRVDWTPCFSTLDNIARQIFFKKQQQVFNRYLR